MFFQMHNDTLNVNFYYLYKFRQLTRKRYKCYYGKAFDQLPNDELSELGPEICAHYSGPDTGINDVSLISHRRLLQKQTTVVCQKTVVEKATINKSLDDLTNIGETVKRTELNGKHVEKTGETFGKGTELDRAEVKQIEINGNPVVTNGNDEKKIELNGNHVDTNETKAKTIELNGNNAKTNGHVIEKIELNGNCKENDQIVGVAVKGLNEDHKEANEIVKDAKTVLNGNENEKTESNGNQIETAGTKLSNEIKIDIPDLKEFIANHKNSPKKSPAPKAPIKSENIPTQLPIEKAKVDIEDGKQVISASKTASEKEVKENGNHSEKGPRATENRTTDALPNIQQVKKEMKGVQDNLNVDKEIKIEVSKEVTENKSPEMPQTGVNPKPKTLNVITEQTLISECWDSFSRSKILKWDQPHQNTYGN